MDLRTSYPTSPLRWLLALCTLFLLPAIASRSLAESSTTTWTEPITLDQVQSGELLCRGGDGLFYPLPLLGMDIDLEVTEILSRGRVDQIFFNPSDEVIEAIYVFPLPEDGAVDAMEMRIGDRIIQSVIKERAEAKATYEKAKSEGRKAALIEQERPNLFTTSVANINPGEVVTVHLEYLEEVAFEDGTYELAFPLTFTPRYAPEPQWKFEPAVNNVEPEPDSDNGPEASPASGGKWREEWERVLAPFQGHGSKTSPRATVQAFIRSGGELTNLGSVSHDIDVDRAEDGYRVRLREKTVVADRDFLLTWSPLPENVPAATAYQETTDNGSFLLATVHSPTAESIQSATKSVDTETLFVIDVSGSMDGPSIDQARKALEQAILRLRPTDRFNILWFNHESGFFGADFVPAEGPHLDRARGWIRRLQADGGTEIQPALVRALDSFGRDSPRHRRIIFLTDGAVANEAELLEAVHARRGGVRIHTIGIGHAPNRHLMFELAEEGRGLCQLIAGAEPVRTKLDRFLARIERPYLQDLELGGLPAGAVTYPAVLPDLYEGEPLHISVKLKDDTPIVRPLELRGTLAGQPWSRKLIVSNAPERAGVGTRWARNRIGEALTEARRSGDRDAAREEVLSLGLGFSLVTPFTSLVAVEQVVTAVGPSQRAPVPNALPAGSTLGGHNPMGGTLPRGGTSEPFLRLLAGLFLLTALSLFGWVWRAQ